MTDDLVKRLRGCKLIQLTTGGGGEEVSSPLHVEAADRIEALETALRRIACDGEPYDKCHCVNSEGCSYGIARAALEEKKDD